MTQQAVDQLEDQPVELTRQVLLVIPEATIHSIGSQVTVRQEVSIRQLVII